MQPDVRVNSYAEEHEAIQTRFGRMFDSAIVPVKYGNHGLLKHGTVTFNDPDDCEQYVQFQISSSFGSSPEITRVFTRNVGIININIFTKRNLGERKGRAVADMIFPIFARVSFNGIQTQAPTLAEVPFNEGWYQINITIPYQWDRCLVN